MQSAGGGILWGQAMKFITSALSATLVIGWTFASHAQAPQPSTVPPPQTATTPAPQTGTTPAVRPSNAPTPKEPSWKEGDNCVQYDGVNVELKSGLRTAGPPILGATYFLPSGTSVDLVLDEPFKDGTRYFAYVEQNEKSRWRLGRGFLTANKLPESHALVKKGVAEASRTLITLRLPASIGSLWRRANLYVYTCVAPGKAASVSQLATRISSPFYSGLVVWSAILVVYLLAAFASKAADTKTIRWYRYLDPVFMTAGTDGKGSLSKLQILFFSLIVFGLVSYIVLRAGVLSDLSPTILLLLGIAGVGSAAAKGADLHRNRIEFENWAWFIRKGWLPQGGLAEVNRASWQDIFTSDGEFDVYRYQSFIFSLAVGLALLVAGVSELASFEIPQTLLGILGLSQAVYIGGKLVSPTSVADLNTATKELRSLEKKFVDTAQSNPDPDPAAGGDALAQARRRAAQLYVDYINKAKDVRILFQSVTGRGVTDAVIEPSLAS